MTKEINLNNAWRVTLLSAAGVPFTQYFEADTMDKAITIAKRSFEANLVGVLSNGVEAQKACKHTIVKERLRFGFLGGWLTVEGGRDIFTMLDEAKNTKFAEGETIHEITT